MEGELGKERRKATHYQIGHLVTLLLVLGVALALRLTAITWGLPDDTHLFSYHPDEFHSLRGALSLALGDLNPHFFNYGSLYLYLVGGAAAVFHGDVFTAIAHAVPGGPVLPEAIRVWTLDARLVTVLLSLATVVTVYLIARDLWGHGAGLAAALLMALMPLHVLQSHYATVDVPGAFFVTLALLFAVRMFQQPTVRTAAWAGAAAGLAASVKYSGAVVLVAPLTAWLVARIWLRPSQPASPPISALIVAPVAAFMAFALTSPYTFLDWQSAWRDISFELQHMRIGDDPAMMAIYPNGWLFHLHGLALGTGLVMLAASAIGLAAGLTAGRRELLPLLIFGLVAFALIGNTAVRYARYEMPLLPVLAVFAGGLVSDDLLRIARHRIGIWALAGVVAVVLVGSVYGAAAIDFRLLGELSAKRPAPAALQGETYRVLRGRNDALVAIEELVPPQGTIGLITEPWFHHPPVDYCNGGPALRSNPIWGAYRRPVRELVILGRNDEVLRESLPDVVVITGSEIDGPLRAGDEGARALMAALKESGYVLVAASQGLSRASQKRRPPASDWLYPFPRIELWARRAVTRTDTIR